MSLKHFFRTTVFGLYGALLRKPVNTLFHIDWYHNAPKVQYMGIGTLQNPMDMWVKQEMLFDIKPDVIIECGTHRGGTALYYAMLFSAFNPEGRIITLDIAPQADEAMRHPLFSQYCTSIVGDTTDPALVERVKELTKDKKVLVILDSDHHKKHVRKEMELYGPLVSPGSYMVVEDTNVNGHPVTPTYGPGPYEAVMEYMKDHPGVFTVDRSREKMRFTYFPKGWLKKN